jgi:hypothetical protein
MRVEKNYFGSGKSKQRMGYTIYDDNNKVLESGYGFATAQYLNHAIALRLRALQGLRPLPVFPKHAREATMAIVETWNDAIYGPYGK